MAEPPRHPKTDDETFVGQDREPGMPRWLSAVVVCFVVLVVLVMVVLHLTGTLGPGSH